MCCAEAKAWASLPKGGGCPGRSLQRKVPEAPPEAEGKCISRESSPDHIDGNDVFYY